MKRPNGIKVLAIAQVLIGGLMILTQLITLIGNLGPSLSNPSSGSSLLDPIVQIPAIAGVIVGFLLLGLGFGMLKLQSWSWFGTLMCQGTGIVLVLPLMLTNPQENQGISLGLVGSTAVIVYLIQTPIRTRFH